MGQQKVNGTYNSLPLDTQDYTYNIRGWLKGINKDFANKNGANANGRWFGMELNYDWGFKNNQLNENIAGIKWRTGGDKEQRAYGFGYDKLNRFLYCDFNQMFSSGWEKSDPDASKPLNINFSAVTGDGNDPNSDLQWFWQ